MIDKNEGVAPASRALGAHARIPELYRQLVLSLSRMSMSEYSSPN